MAEAQGKLDWRPGICFVKLGPGATNASIGVHTAFQDSTPPWCFLLAMLPVKPATGKRSRADFSAFFLGPRHQRYGQAGRAH
jgi:hypothetical protein